TGWSLQIRPVFSGDEIAAGDGTVRVTSWDNGPATIDYELPAFSSSAVKPDVAAKAEGVLRRTAAKGTITINARDTHQAVFSPPAFWPGGSTTAPGPLLWLPPEVTAALKTNSKATMKVAPLPNGLQMRTEPAAGGDSVTISV